jgi:D-alanyl-D-alanine carboxypeptidase
VRLGVARLGKEWILPVTANKATRQAAIIADLEPAAAQRLCADYQARKLFCQVKKPEEIVPPFGAFWR